MGEVSVTPRERAALAAVLGLWGLAAARAAWLCDDAFIAFRYARQAALGRGVVFNPGQTPIEGYSDPLWVALAIVPEWLGLPTPFLMQALGWLCGLAVLGLTWRTLRRDLATPAGPALALTAVLAASPPMVVWATSGLETMAVALLLLGAWRAAALSERTGPIAAWLVALALIRGEGPAWVAVVVVSGAWARARSDRPQRPLALAGTATLALIAAHVAWRLATYGDWIPNTFRAKAAASPAVLVRGARYVLGALVSLATPVLGLVAAPRALRHPLGPPLALVVLAALGQAVAGGGDFMAFWRLLVPVWPLLAVLAGPAVAAWADGRPTGVTRTATLAVVGLSLLPLVGRHLAPTPVRLALDVRGDLDDFTAEVDKWRQMEASALRWRVSGRVLSGLTEPGESLVLGAVGAMGYEAIDLVVYDRHGLTDADVAERPVTELRAPGHDKLVSYAWFLPREPTFLGFHLSPDGTPRAELEKAAQRMVGRDPKRRYAPELHAVDVDGAAVWAILARRHDDPASARAAARAFEDHLRNLPLHDRADRTMNE